MERRAAFTLIELLVVITIIAILAGLLFPVFAQAKASAGDIKTVSNARQLGTAFELYVGDNDDVYPQCADGTPGIDQLGGWMYYSAFGNMQAGTFDVTKGSLWPYVKAKGIYLSNGDPDANKSGNSFAMNGFLDTWTGTGMNQGKSTTSVPLPSSTMLLGEEGTGKDQLTFYGYIHGTNDAYINPAVDHFGKFHFGKSVVIYGDTHAKLVDAQGHFTETICGQPVVCW